MPGLVIEGDDGFTISTIGGERLVQPPQGVYGTLLFVQAIPALVKRLDGLLTVLARLTPAVMVDIHDMMGAAAIVEVGMELMDIRDIANRSALHLPAALAERLESELGLLYPNMLVLRARWKTAHPAEPLTRYFPEYFEAAERFGPFGANLPLPAVV